MQQQKKNPQENDVKLPSPPSDSISSLSVNGSETVATNMLIATSWDNSVSCYEVQSSQQQQSTGGFGAASVPVTQVTNVIMQSQMKHDAPVLCSTINPVDNMTVYSGGCDNTVRMWNPAQGPSSAQIVGRHDLSVVSVKYIQDKNLLISSSWDKTIRAWDLRQPNPAATISLSDKVFCMDAQGPAVVAVTADKQVHVFDMTAGNKISEFKSPLSYQTRTVSIFADRKGFAMGCIEGRIALEHFDELQNKTQTTGLTGSMKPPTKNFVFKCHRDANDIFSVNAIAFHNKNTFCSAGSDGVLSFWDKDARHRLANLDLQKRVCPITSIAINPMGNMLFYSMSYDWSRGAENHDPSKFAPCIYYHPLAASEITPKEKAFKK